MHSSFCTPATFCTPASTLEPELRTYLETRNQQTIFIANIESTPGLKNLDEILALGALDSVLIGPHDLSCSLGIPEKYEHPRFAEAVESIFHKARRNHCGAGIHWWNGVGDELRWAHSGANLIMHSPDITLVVQHLQQELQALKSRLGESGTQVSQLGDVSV